QAGSKTPSGADLMAAARRFPEARYEAVLARGQAAVYQAVRETLTARLAELGDSGRLLKAEAARWKKEAGAARAAAAGSPVRPVLPPGCESVDDAVGRVLEGLSAADLLAVDRRIGPVGLAAGGPVGVRERVRAAAREYLADRLAAADLGGMLANPGEAVRGAFAAAEPGWVGRGPWAKTDLVVVGAPPGPGRDLVPAAVPVDEFADTPDELVIVREYPTVPLSAVPHLGPAGHAAYRAIPEATQCTAHSRFDITQWVGPDEG
ncbi:MAG: hypothetical protein K2X82_26155, partial [Gemmataceae bacterium]|nr:hypothetical protein [Gemmataceae bacterium]